MITFKELSEAHKVGDKVTIVKGPKDVKGKEGRIGEIRKQAYKGAPKTYTVDYDHHETTGERKSVQLQAKHIKGVKEQVETLQEKHRVAITLSDPNHPAVTKRKELIQKTVRVKADNPGHAVDSAIHHFRKAGYKVHDHNYIGTVKENMDESALETFRQAAAEREKKHDEIERKRKEDAAQGKENMSGSIDRLAKQLNKEDTNLEEGTFKYHMDKAVAAHDRGDVNRKKFHLSNAKQARYALKSTDIPKHKDLLDKYKSMTEGTDLEEARGLADKYYKMAQDRKDTAQENKGNREVYHTHMADHHDHMSRYHEELGQHSLAQAHADKADIHHEKSMQKNEAIQEGRDYDDNRRGFGKPPREDDEYHVPDPEVKKNKAKKEDVAANNVGSGNIAGTQGDAGKKTVMTKAPLKRKLKFEEFSNLLDDCICETADAGLAAKAAKSGISIGTLRKVYRRGVAAWNSGHRPGTTPQQWGMARVNSYITKGKGTYHGADKDLREDSRSDNDAYHKGVSDSTAKARVSHWKKMDKLSDKNPEAYKPAPGDATAKTKLSKHTIKYRQMFGEDMDEELYEACWDTHKQIGMKKKNGKMVPNCVPKNESVEEQFDMIEEVIEELASLHGVDSDEIWQDLETIDDDELLEYAIDAKGHKSSTGGLTQKGVDAYNAKTGGNLKTAVTTKPSKLKPGSKAANRRKSFCARMGGMKKRLTSAKTANDPDSRINKALRKWNC
jgi:hypothetical protein